MAVSQASQTPGLGPNSSPRVGGKNAHRYGGRGRSKACVSEHKDILICQKATVCRLMQMDETSQQVWHLCVILVEPAPSSSAVHARKS